MRVRQRVFQGFVLVLSAFLLVGRAFERRPRWMLVLSLVGLLVVVVLWGSAQEPVPDAPPPTGLHSSLVQMLLATPLATRPPPTPTPVPDFVGDACQIDVQARAMRAGTLDGVPKPPLYVCYDLFVALEPGANAYSGTATLTVFNNTNEPLLDLLLRTYPNAQTLYGGSLQITAAQVNMLPVVWEEDPSDPTIVRFPLPEALPPHGALRLNLAFEGRVPQDFGSPTAYGTFNVVSGQDTFVLASWYPRLAPWRHGAWLLPPVPLTGDALDGDVALYTVRVRLPPGWRAAATGFRLGVQDEPAGTVHHFVSGPARHFMLVAGSGLVDHTAEGSGVRLVHWSGAALQAAGASVLETARQALAFFEERFGPYPYTELDVVAVPLQRVIGMEFPGLFLLDAGLYGRPSLLNLGVVHEIAHQWWYGVVGSHSVAAPWQDEALAEYSAVWFFEHHSPSLATALLAGYRQRVVAAQASGRLQALGAPATLFGTDQEAYWITVYDGGVLFFGAVRARIGDEAFETALQHYYRQNAFGLAEPEALLDTFEEACSCQLDDLYARWGVRRGEP